MSDRAEPSAGVNQCDHCEREASWTWHDGAWSGGRYCDEHIRPKLENDDKLPAYRDRITTSETATRLRGQTLILPAGAKPLDSTFPVVRSKEALDEVLIDGQ